MSLVKSYAPSVVLPLRLEHTATPSVSDCHWSLLYHDTTTLALASNRALANSTLTFPLVEGPYNILPRLGGVEIYRVQCGSMVSGRAVINLSSPMHSQSATSLFCAEVALIPPQTPALDNLVTATAYCAAFKAFVWCPICAVAKPPVLSCIKIALLVPNHF
jgi:hypothetical protein